MFNFLSLLGWSLDDKTELISRDDIVKNFSLERISKTAAIFNKDKLEWMNGVYIRNLSLDDFVKRAMPVLERGLPVSVRRPLDVAYIKAMLPLIQERTKMMSEIPALVDFFFYDELSYETGLLQGKLELGQAVNALRSAMTNLEQLEVWTTESMENKMRPLCLELGLKPAIFFGMLRVAITGRTVSPPLFQTMEVLGKQRSFHRLNDALRRLEFSQMKSG